MAEINPDARATEMRFTLPHGLGEHERLSVVFERAEVHIHAHDNDEVIIPRACLPWLISALAAIHEHGGPEG